MKGHCVGKFRANQKSETGFPIYDRNVCNKHFHMDEGSSSEKPQTGWNPVEWALRVHLKAIQMHGGWGVFIVSAPPVARHWCQNLKTSCWVCQYFVQLVPGRIALGRPVPYGGFGLRNESALTLSSPCQICACQSCLRNVVWKKFRPSRVSGRV